MINTNGVGPYGIHNEDQSLFSAFQSDYASSSMHPSRGPQISFGSTFPNLVLGTNIHFDLTNCQYEQVEVRDQLFIYDFCVKYMFKEEAEKAEEHDEGASAERYSEKELETVGWLVSIDGEFKEHPFGFLRPVRNQVQ